MLIWNERLISKKIPFQIRHITFEVFQKFEFEGLGNGIVNVLHTTRHWNVLSQCCNYT